MSNEEHHWNFISLIAWLKKLCSMGPWLVSGRKGWLTFSILVLLLLSPYFFDIYFSASEDGLKYYGLSVQITGFIFTLYGVNSILKQVGLPSIFHRTWNYFRSMPVLPIKRTRIVSASGNVNVGLKTNFQASAIYVGELSIEDRIEELEKSTQKITQEISDLKKMQEKEKEKILDEIKTVKRDSSQAIEDLRSKVSQVFEGGVVVEVFGIGLFIIGTIYATIPDVLIAVF